MEHHMNVGETSEENALVKRIDKSVHELPRSANECFIYKVHEGLRKGKPEAYEPVLVSIGPYHSQNPRLPAAMKQHKLRYLRSLLERLQVKSVNEYISLLQKLEVRARKCYLEPIDHLNSNDDFVEMMLLDGCFIIEYFYKILLYVDEDDPILKVNGMRAQICLDLILLENQLPYFVLSQLYDIFLSQLNAMTITAENQSPHNFLPEILKVLSISDMGHMAMSVFKIVLPKPHDNFIKGVGNNDTEDTKHLLHLLHILCAPSSSESSDDNNEVIDQNPPLFHLIHIPCFPSSKERTDEVIDHNRPLLDQNRPSSKSSYDDDEIRSLSHPVDIVSGSSSEGRTDEVKDQNRPSSEKGTPKNDHQDEILLQVRSVVELQEAGVEFKKASKTDSTVSLFDIKFRNGLMEIPSFYVEDSTDTLFRNLIAYEQHSPDVEYKYFTDFTVFMDRLITSEKDVEVLRLKEIVVNLLGDDKVVSELFNRLGDGVIFSSGSNFRYFKECSKVNDHCRENWNELKARLRRDYFNNPWASVSTLAAGLLLLLTIVQTIVALITLFT
ncbi:hypothetical protein L1049_010913 [Liquidambar formosana]|uniref:Uncharacterized protein n=1 Tax=Liquidambar formosana TaxID=63359 RepID=A0AAP0RQR7_LIQFO